jgi:hypothetical protein
MLLASLLVVLPALNSLPVLAALTGLPAVTDGSSGAPAASPLHDSIGMPLAVLPLRSEGLQLNEAQRLDGLIRDRGAVVAGYRVQTATDTTALLEAAQSLGVSCDLAEPACGAQIGVVAAVDRVVVGRAARVPANGPATGGVGIELTLVDATTQAVLRHAIALLPEEPAAQVAAFDAIGQVLFGKDIGAPWLLCNGTPAGAVVSVDGLEVGPLPFARPLAGVVAGQHHVTVRAPGFLPSSTVVTTAGVAPTIVDVALVVDPQALREVVSPEQIAVAYGTAGVGGVLFLAGGVTSILASGPWFAFQEAQAELDGADPTSPDYAGFIAAKHNEALAAQEAWNGGASVLTAVGLVSMATGLVAGIGGATWAFLLQQAADEAGAVKGDEGAASSTTATAPAATSQAATTLGDDSR